MPLIAILVGLPISQALFQRLDLLTTTAGVLAANDWLDQE